jgi:threonine/homoserine/homoserine lactone efflux protein
VRGRRHEHRPRGSAAGFRQGLLSNLANPKMAVFFTSLLPQFATGFGQLLALGLVFATITLVWLSAYALAVARTKRWLVRGRVRRALDAVTGVALVGFGTRLALER